LYGVRKSVRPLSVIGGGVERVHDPAAGAVQAGQGRAADHDREHREQPGDQDADADDPA